MVVEAHRSRVAEQFEIACCRATGRIEDAERLERRREQIEGAADAVEAGVRKTQSRPDYWVPAVADETLESPPGADAFAKAVYGEVRDRYDRHAVAEDRDARFGPSDREASEQCHLDALVAETLGCQQQAWIASERESPPESRADVRERFLREHRLEVQGIFLAACQASRRSGTRIERRPDRVSATPLAVECEPRRETVHAISGTGFDGSAGNHEGGRPSLRPRPSEHRPRRDATEQTSPSSVPVQPAMPAAAPTSTGTSVDKIGEGDDERAGRREARGDSPRPSLGERRPRRAPTEQASPSSAPATPAMPAAAPKAKGAAANRGTEVDEPDGPGLAHAAPVRLGTASRSSPKSAKDRRCGRPLDGDVRRGGRTACDAHREQQQGHRPLTPASPQNGRRSEDPILVELLVDLPAETDVPIVGSAPERTGIWSGLNLSEPSVQCCPSLAISVSVATGCSRARSNPR